MRQRTVLLIGKRPPPVTGTSMWAQIVCESTSWSEWKATLFDINLNSSINDIGRITVRKYIESLMIVLRFIRTLFVEKPDALIVPLSQTVQVFLRDAVFVLLARLFRIPVVTYLHGSAFREAVYERAVVLKPIILMLLRISSRIVVLTPSLRAIFSGLVKEKKIHVICNGIDVPHNCRGPLTYNVLFLGNLMLSKGIEDYLGAANVLAESNPKILFHIIGEIGDAASRNLIQTYIEKPNIRYHGVLHGDDKYAIMHASDIMVFPPRGKEGQPMVLLEGMAAELAIITTPMGGIVDTVSAETAIIIEPGNPELIAMHILALYENPERMRTMARRAHRRYEMLFTEQCMIANIENLLNTVLVEKKG